eukprot:GHVS01091282.1.p1 GENE.GHVS01091282.1~~GHVS01091282.1.p1  ORF type:complete len:119 (-),score=13.06 GHVS01091282.1:356-712(-)
MVWAEWWPYDPVPTSTHTDPFKVKVEKGKLYWWCACGRSQNQPWCDGSHKGTGFKPKMFVPMASGTKFLCGCKLGEKRPVCDLGCLTLKFSKKPAMSAAMSFAVAFAGTYCYTWLFHP